MELIDVNCKNSKCETEKNEAHNMGLKTHENISLP